MGREYNGLDFAHRVQLLEAVTDDYGDREARTVQVSAQPMTQIAKQLTKKLGFTVTSANVQGVLDGLKGAGWNVKFAYSTKPNQLLDMETRLEAAERRISQLEAAQGINRASYTPAQQYLDL